MFKSQMKYQKILCFAALVLAAVLFVYALGFITDLYDLLYFTLDLDEGVDYTEVEGTQFFWELQTYVLYENVGTETIAHRHVGFTDKLVTVAVVGILLAVAAYVTRNNSRRKYYVSNYVSSALYCVYNLFAAVWISVNVADYKQKFALIDFEMLEEYCKIWKIEFNPTTRCFDWGFVLSGLLVVVAVAVALNLIWKITLTKRENTLLNNGAMHNATESV